MGPIRTPIFIATIPVNVMTKKKLIVFKLDTCILCTLLAPLNYIARDDDDSRQILC